MTSLHCVDVSFAYTDAVPLIANVNLHLVPGWVGVVGANGAGKTTFLRLLARELTPDRGQVVAHPAGASACLCPQTVEHLGGDILAFAGATTAAATRIRARLELHGEDLHRWHTLSPGERKRWQIGTALAADPQLLLLDEPTNHLDGGARALLMQALTSFQGIGLVVSHDRELLDGLTASTLRFHMNDIRLWRGAYSHARAAWEAVEREREEAYERVRAEARRLRRRLADKRRGRAAAERKTRSSQRMKSRHDHDASGMMTKGKARAAEAGLAHDIGVVRRKLERTAAVAESFRFQKTPGRSIFVDYVRAPMPYLMRLDLPALRVGGQTLLEHVHLAVGRESRIRLVGANGCGKSSLLEALITHARLAPSQLLYLPQELQAEQEVALLQSVRTLPPAERGRVLSLVAALGAAPEQLLDAERPSPGQARKLMMAYGLGRHVWGLVLDEPTNHLDLPSVERLEEALAGYPGALVLVTHDHEFAVRCTSTVWQVNDRRVTVLDGEAWRARESCTMYGGLPPCLPSK